MCFADFYGIKLSKYRRNQAHGHGTGDIGRGLERDGTERMFLDIEHESFEQFEGRARKAFECGVNGQPAIALTDFIFATNLYVDRAEFAMDAKHNLVRASAEDCACALAPPSDDHRHLRVVGLER